MSLHKANSNLARLLLFAAALIGSSSGADSSDVKSYVIETRIFVDQTGVKHWKSYTNNSVEAEINTLFVEIGEIYKVLESSNLDVKFAITEITLLDKDIFYYKSDRFKYHSNTALDEAVAWIGKRKEKYDLAVFYTGYDLYNEYGYNRAGESKINDICTPSGVLITEIFKTPFTNVLTTAHEIGHVLGLNHDGFADSNDCKSESYIMSADLIANSINQFNFSSCSRRNLEKKLAEPSHQCLNNATNYPIVQGERMGLLMSPDKMCVQMWGEGAYTNRKWSDQYREEICIRFYCYQKGNQYGSYFPTPQGMICGKEKRCIRGRCVKTDNGDPNVSDSCPFGDQPAVIGARGKSIPCSSLADDPGMCADFKKECCATCANVE